MPSHDLPAVELKALSEKLAENPDASTLINQWKREINYDFKAEFGKHLKKVTTKKTLSHNDKLRTDIFCKAAAAINALDGREAKGRTSNAVQVNVMTVDPTKR